MNVKRVVVWGHKPRVTLGYGRYGIRSHTHSYIHAGYFAAFKRLGFETLWLDNERDLPDDAYSDHLFFTEGQVDGNLPITKNNFYVTHHSEPSRYELAGDRWIQLSNFVTDLLSGKSYSYPDSPVSKLDDVTYWDDRNRVLYQPWATDIFPEDEWKFEPYVAQGKVPINYVGTTNHDGIERRFNKVSKKARDMGYSVKVHVGVSDTKAQNLIRQSAVCFDIRGDWHLERGYIPCRLWKTLSYGRMVTSNSQLLEPIFLNRIGFQSDENKLLETAFQNEIQSNLDQIREAQSWVLLNHTFLNRANRVLEMLGLEK